MLGASVAEAGLFDKLKAKKKAKNAPANVQKLTPRPQHRSHYRDAHGDAYINQALLKSADGKRRKVIVDIGRQRAFLVIDDLVAIDTAISSARRGKHTPRGSYQITEKVASGKVSTLYHVFMPYWMRLGRTTVGMHVGDVPGYPASAGCIRLPQQVAPILFEHVSHGTPVDVVDSWDESGLRLPYTMRKPGAYVDT
ncbi:MAG: L,D-transpeptidase [Verrucomicrobia bacterium]|nr:L,D-transpeptidase [Verrucomicrobiota bacterium]